MFACYKSLVAVAVVAALICPINANPNKVKCGKDYTASTQMGAQFMPTSTATITDNGGGSITVTFPEGGETGFIVWLSDSESAATIKTATVGTIQACASAWHYGSGTAVLAETTVDFTVEGAGDVTFGFAHGTGKGQNLKYVVATIDVTAQTTEAETTTIEATTEWSGSGVAPCTSSTCCDAAYSSVSSALPAMVVKMSEAAIGADAMWCDTAARTECDSRCGTCASDGSNAATEECPSTCTNCITYALCDASETLSACKVALTNNDDTNDDSAASTVTAAASAVTVAAALVSALW